MTPRLTVRDLLLSARRGGFVLRTPFRRSERSTADTRELALRVAAWLEREGFGTGDRAAIWGPSGPDWVAAFLGCALRGVVVVPLEDAAGPEFAARVQAEAQVKLAFVGRPAAEVADRVFPGARLVQLEDLAGLVAGIPPVEAATLPAAPDEQLLEIVFTSGTTSDPKGVLLTHGNLLAILRALQRPYRKWNARLGWLVRRRPVLTLLPLSHMFGQVVGVFVPLMMDLVSVFVAPQAPAAIRETLKVEGIWVALTVPRFLSSLRKQLEVPEALLDASSPSRLALLRMRLAVRRKLGVRFCCFIVGGAALDPDEEHAWRRMGYLIAQGYGLTETAPIVTLSSPFSKARGGVGRPLRGQEVRLSPEGEVLVRGGNVTAGYLRHGEIESVTDAEGWFHTGDLGELDERGRLRIIGRSKDVVVTAEGLNVHARDVELVLARDARVRDAAIVGLPREQGEEVHAVLLLEPDARSTTDSNDVVANDAHAANDAVANDAVANDAVANDVIARANAALPPYQRVRSWTRWPGADFPRTPSTGKVKKRELLALLFGGASSMASAPAHAAGDPLETALGALHGGGEQRSLAELGLSSLETVELVSRLEGEYQVVLDESRVRPDMSLAELRSLVVSPSSSGPPVRIDMPRWARAWWARKAGALLRGLLAYPALRFSARPFVVTGREHLESIAGPVLLVGNHSSYLDAPAVFRALPRRRRDRTGCAMATEPFHPLFTPAGTGTRAQKAGQLWRYVATVLAFGAFPLPRAGGFRASLEYAGELVNHGWSVLIFPEGRMSTTGALQPFRGGAGLLAKELRIPVVPFRITGLWEVLPPEGGWRPKPGPVTLRFGAAIRFEPGASAEECVKEMERAVAAL